MCDSVCLVLGLHLVVFSTLSMYSFAAYTTHYVCLQTTAEN